MASYGSLKSPRRREIEGEDALANTNLRVAACVHNIAITRTSTSAELTHPCSLGLFAINGRGRSGSASDGRGDDRGPRRGGSRCRRIAWFGRRSPSSAAAVRERAVARVASRETEHTVYLRDPEGRRLGVSTFPLD
jgi:hypothetical protein